MKTTMILLCLFFFGITATAQINCNTNCNWSDTLNVSTGIGLDGILIENALLPCIDPYWKLINVAPPSANNTNGIEIPIAWDIPTASAGITTPDGHFPGPSPWSFFANDWNEIPGAKAVSAINTKTFSTNNDTLVSTKNI